MRIKVETTSGRVALAEGIELPRSCRVTLDADASDPDLPYAGEARLVFRDGRMQVKRLTLSQVEGGPPVDGQALRQVPRAITRAVVQRLARADMQGAGAALGLARLGAKRPALVAEQGPTDEALELLASIYRLAHVAGDPPARTVTNVFEIPRSTAGRWIQLARQRGFLGPAEDRRAGEKEA